ncbi:PAS domain-containing sensor histidine kinase [Sphingomonas sp. LHG3406-1]|uniref:sensor histidine kinase n=1 Tax=Sphingomonas sp. LHG3406-1 TaxID=2804617 RepID=UPI00262F8B50|nr:PAS domain-containing sensor histidine kinase [Sphingomonas sp. LHG3406-1]
MPVTIETVALALAALWLPLAFFLAWRGVRQSRRAAQLSGHARAIGALLAAAPARPMLVLADRTIDAEANLLRDLGSEGATRFEELGGLADDDRAALEQELAAAGLGPGRIERTVFIASSGRLFDLRGGPAPPPSPPGSVLLWVADCSIAERERARVAGQLAATEQALSSLTQLIEAAPFPMWVRDGDLKLALVNRAFVSAVEAADAGEVVARGIELVEDSADLPSAGAALALEQKQPVERIRPVTIGGERRMLRLVEVPLPGGAVAGYAVDIQELEDARYELERYALSQRELSDRMTAGAVQFDPDRTLSFYNRPFAILSGLEHEWLDEGPEFDRLLERMRENHRLPEVRDFPEWKAERRGWFTSAEEVHEEEWILANGDHLRVVGQPLPGGGLRLIFEDRTEQVRLASARDTLLRVRTATFDNLFEGVAVFASDGRLYLWNRRFGDFWNLDEGWLAEHPRVDELVPAFAVRLVNPTAAATLRELVRAATTERRAEQGRLSLADGRHFAFAAVPLPDGNALFTMIDVTDSSRIESALRERAEALEQADKVRTDFVANMSYELRTPLTSIGGFAEMLQGGYAGELSGSARDYVAAILESVARLSRLIDDVLDLTQGARGDVALERERVDLAGLVRTVAEGMEPQAKAKRLKFKVAIGEGTGSLQGDSRRLRESLEHVLRNAIAYTDKGEVRLVTRGDAEAAEIMVSDTGRGMPPEHQTRVFERFTRFGEKRGEAALGLGLPLTRQFIEAHGGTVELSSREGQGTSVLITLPRGGR